MTDGWVFAEAVYGYRGNHPDELSFEVQTIDGARTERSISSCPCLVFFDPGARALSWQKGAQLLILGNAVDPGWWSAADKQGSTGVVPANFLRILVPEKQAERLQSSLLGGPAPERNQSRGSRAEESAKGTPARREDALASSSSSMCDSSEGLRPDLSVPATAPDPPPGAGVGKVLIVHDTDLRDAELQAFLHEQLALQVRSCSCASVALRVDRRSNALSAGPQFGVACECDVCAALCSICCHPSLHPPTIQHPSLHAPPPVC